MNDPFTVAALLAAWLAGVFLGLRTGRRSRLAAREQHRWAAIDGIRLVDWWWPPEPYDWATDPDASNRLRRPAS